MHEEQLLFDQLDLNLKTDQATGLPTAEIGTAIVNVNVKVTNDF